MSQFVFWQKNQLNSNFYQKFFLVSKLVDQKKGKTIVFVCFPTMAPNYALLYMCNKQKKTKRKRKR